MAAGDAPLSNFLPSLSMLSTEKMWSKTMDEDMAVAVREANGRCCWLLHAVLIAHLSLFHLPYSFLPHDHHQCRSVPVVEISATRTRDAQSAAAQQSVSIASRVILALSASLTPNPGAQVKWPTENKRSDSWIRTWVDAFAGACF